MSEKIDLSPNPGPLDFKKLTKEELKLALGRGDSDAGASFDPDGYSLKARTDYVPSGE